MKYFFVSILVFTVTTVVSQTISLTGSIYSQDFNTLSSTAGSTTNNLTIPGWYLIETGGGARDNDQYAVDNGGSTTGDMYSYGTTANTDRALGGLRSGTLMPVFGAFFTNNTGVAITSLTVKFIGELWRLGTAGRTDQITFQYSTDATSLTTGTWTNVAALNFVTPNTITTGAKDGNAAANRTALAASITGLSIANGSSFFIRWTEIDATSADDGLAIDDFTLETNVILPVSLISFSATKESNTSKICWTTAEEINTSIFKVQRSAGDATNWQIIATVQAMGQSSTLVNYQVYDANPGAGNNLYRLLSIDIDDKLYYSPIRRVNFNKKYTYSIYPNPAKDIVYITTDNINGINGVLVIENMHGQSVLSKRAAVATGVLPLNVSTLTSGLYLLKIIHNDGEVYTMKLVRQ